MGEPFSEKEFEKLKINRASKEEIEAHEILFDAKKFKKDSPILEAEGGKLELPIKSINFIALFFLIIFSFLVLLGKIAYLQIWQSQDLEKKAENNRLRIYSIPAKRGIIYDNNLSALVFNSPSFDIVVDPQQLPHTQGELKVLTQELAKILEKTSSEIEKIFEENIFEGQPFLLSENIDHNAILFFETNKFPGVFLEKSSAREYPFAKYLAHLLGYTGKVNQREIQNNPDYFIADIIGKDGLENSYEKVLRGKVGKRIVERDARGKKISEKIDSLPEDGKNLQLFLDNNFQKKLYDILEGKLRELGLKRASGLAIDPKTGGILAMVSLPSFDNNLFTKGISQKELEALLKNSAKPLLNRAISGVYPSGSTIKPFLASAALQEKIITPTKSIFAPESIQVGAWNFSDWKFHGWINLYQAIAQSSNVYFYTVGGGYGDIKGLGVERIKKYLSLFGWGKKLGIDLPGETPGFLPDSQWKKESFGENWYIGDTYNLSIGQGYLGVTPLQLAAAISAIANGGTLFKPQLAAKIVGQDKETIQEFQPEILNQDFIDPKNLEDVRKGMREGVVSGSSRFLADFPVKVAGKTGTAQTNIEGRTHAWWTGFAPYDNPEIVLTILIEEGGEGSSAAVPVVKETLGWYFQQASMP